MNMFVCMELVFVFFPSSIATRFIDKHIVCIGCCRFASVCAVAFTKDDIVHRMYYLMSVMRGKL